MHRFAVDLAKLALRIAERHGSSGERWYVTPFLGYFRFTQTI